MTPYPNLPYSHNGMKVFEAVARLMSFTLAADELNVTQSAVSRQVRQLEDDLSASLILRKHRSIELTEKGQTLYKTLQKGFKELEHLVGQWKAPQKKRIVIKSALSFATRTLIPKVMELNERYPEHEIVIVPSIDDDPDLTSGEFDLQIINSRRPEKYQGKAHVTFLRDEYMAPIYAESLGMSFMDLNRVLALPRLHSTLDHYDWNAWLSGIEERSHRSVRNTSFISLDLAISGCLAGQGATVTDLLLVLPELKRGFLRCPVEAKIQASAWRYYCYCPNPSSISKDLLLWLEEDTAREEAELKRLANSHGWIL
ncbi:LysR family transcriptional regulator [Vibrio sinensis]|uniref:LysR family transcriptional regulator n=1 Tax=Vibrio sinensis TaxID=2302434 RepID=A0A3A6QDY2_9VIBR|nr:LysR family transcriptional regulator [Vibrio sinensis]RJX70141.1 LysR family transcriptional regulator [Vibrio sinensis]